MGETETANRHRADYILERGIWRASCRLCDYRTTDPSRRRAAADFRNHIRDTSERLLDLRVREPQLPLQIRPA
jgi:hypothetical protein